jgi:hypothetical protein
MKLFTGPENSFEQNQKVMTLQRKNWEKNII